MPGRKILARGYTTFIALLCTAAVAYAIHANGEAAKAGRAAERAQKWERYARATRVHRLQTGKSLRVLVRQYNKLARNATAEQRRLLATLTRARKRAASASPGGAPPVTYETQSLTITQPAVQAPLPAAAAAAPADPMTKTS